MHLLRLIPTILVILLGTNLPQAVPACSLNGAKLVAMHTRINVVFKNGAVPGCDCRRLALRGGAPDDGSAPQQAEVTQQPESVPQETPRVESGEGKPRGGGSFKDDLTLQGLYAPSKERPGGGDYVHQRFLGQEVQVEFDGGVTCRGVLKAFDALGNMVLDDTVQHLFENEDDPSTRVWEGKTRKLGYVIMIGKNVKSIIPVDGFREIPNPFPDREPHLP